MTGDVLAAKFVSPPYTAYRPWVPLDSPDVLHVALVLALSLEIPRRMCNPSGLPE